jgi:hypothetical protein
MHGNIILVLESNIELLPVCDDIGSDVKVSRLDLVLLKECVKVIGWLDKHVKMGSQNSDEAKKRVTHRKRTVVERDTDDTLRSIKYVTGITTTV